MGSIVAVPLTVALTLISTRPTDFPTFCKWLYSYLYIVISQLFTKKRFDLYDMEAQNDPYKVGFLPHPLEMELESPQPDAHLQHAADEIFFYGVNSKSESLIVRIARTVNHEAEAWIYMKLKDGKIYNLHKTMGYQNSCSDAGREFTCGGLKIHYMSPMRRWRIFYNGLLRETSEVDPSIDKLRYVKFAFIWCASSDLFDMQTDVDSAPLAMAIANSKWKSWQVPMKKMQDALNFYAQGGNIHGTISIDGDSSDHLIYLYGERIRFLGKTFLEEGAQFTHVLGQIPKNGSIIHIGLATIPGIAKELKFGFIVLPTGRLAPFSDIEMQLENIHVDGSEDVKALFHANGLEFKVKGTLAGRLSRFESNKGWDGSLTMDWLNIELNQNKGSGILIKGRILKPSLRSIPTDIKEIPKVRPLLVHFSEESCEISELTGGKGSSLGKLTQLSKQYQNFIVPNGVVVTTSSYEAFVNSDIRMEIKSLEDVLYGKTSGDAKEACKRVMDEVVKANVPDTVLQAVVKGLKKTFGEQMQSKKFAVRSSATGEDTEQMSAAGQMDTYLGVSGLSEIVSSVKKCWASQFSFIAVQYKKQNGQIINSPMAVVIQEMIPCDVAGVLFTCDPLTGNPTRMSITANYGLGESVVSGSEEPDTIELTKNERNELEITNKIIGSKAHRIIVRDDEGTTLQEVSEKEKSACCLSDILSLRLGNIAIHIEKSYRSNRDIEWGFWNNNLYIFQSRPVTSGTGETDYEIDHERDGPLRIDSEYFCVCNVGEVMPGATSPLGIDIVFKYFNIAFQRRTEAKWQGKLRPKYFSKGMINMYYHAMFYCIDEIGEGRKALEATMIGLFGRVLDDEDLFEIALERYGTTTTAAAQGVVGKYYRLTKTLFNSKRRLEKALKFYAKYHVPVEKQKTSREVFDTLMHACDDMTESMTCHMLASQSSSIWNMIIMSTIEKARGGGIGPEVYRDFSKLLSSISEVESADVPSAMQSLAYHIGKEINPEDFKKMNSEEILQRLKTSPTEAGIKFRDFLEKHGHRCLKEVDVRSITWGKDPKILIQLLQNLVGNVTKDSSPKKIENFDQILNDLGVSMKTSTRFLLKYLLLPQCRKAVQTRERSKSLMMKLLDDWRKGYVYLAKVMTLEGRIPEEDVMFFMNLEEISELINTRSPKIITIANHRRRRFPELDSYIFPEIMKGVPKPINMDDTPIVINEDNFKMQGIPVSQGVARGFVRVAFNLEEASHLKPGEILLTYSTDIGWTPYFPSLAGVVTELGGLISHGAVVSREYGLPCINGLHGATRQFQTGDYVLLDGNKGILQKLSPPE